MLYIRVLSFGKVVIMASFKYIWFVRVLCIGELGVLMLFYLFGTQGLYAIKRHMADNAQLQAELVILEKQVQALQQELQAHIQDPFFQEALARKLHYAYPHEEIYIIPTHTVG
jgi:cell division protein FtsB